MSCNGASLTVQVCGSQCFSLQCQWNDDAEQGLKPNMNLGALLMNFLNLFGNIVR
jgi:hypothetical protein